MSLLFNMLSRFVIAFLYINVFNYLYHYVVLEKILESPLDSKEIKPVNPKGN